MPDIDRSGRPDLTDIADDDVLAIKDKEIRDALYRVTEKLKRILEYQESVFDSITDVVQEIQDSLP